MTKEVFDSRPAQTGNEVSRRLSEQHRSDSQNRRAAVCRIRARIHHHNRPCEGGTDLRSDALQPFRHEAEAVPEMIKRNSQDRLAALRKRFFSVPDLPPLECIESMAESTVLACVEDPGNASVMVWGLMEMPEFAADIYRAEIGSTEALWNAEIRTRFRDSLVRSRLAVHLVPYAGHACMAFGFWLATLRHKPATAQAHACQYAGAVVYVARAVLNIPPESLEATVSWLPAQREVTR